MTDFGRSVGMTIVTLITGVVNRLIGAHLTTLCNSRVMNGQNLKHLLADMVDQHSFQWEGT